MNKRQRQLENEIEQLKRRLASLEIQLAGYGALAAPVHLIIQIEGAREKLAILTAFLESREEPERKVDNLTVKLRITKHRLAILEAQAAQMGNLHIGGSMALKIELTKEEIARIENEIANTQKLETKYHIPLHNNIQNIQNISVLLPKFPGIILITTVIIIILALILSIMLINKTMQSSIVFTLPDNFGVVIFIGVCVVITVLPFVLLIISKKNKYVVTLKDSNGYRVSLQFDIENKQSIDTVTYYTQQILKKDGN